MNHKKEILFCLFAIFAIRCETLLAIYPAYGFMIIPAILLILFALFKNKKE